MTFGDLRSVMLLLFSIFEQPIHGPTVHLQITNMYFLVEQEQQQHDEYACMMSTLWLTRLGDVKTKNVCIKESIRQLSQLQLSDGSGNTPVDTVNCKAGVCSLLGANYCMPLPSSCPSYSLMLLFKVITLIQTFISY